MSTGMCFVTFPRMGGVMVQAMLRQICHELQLHVKATSDHSLINTTRSHQCMSNFKADFWCEKFSRRP